MLSLIIPTYNERSTLPKLLTDLFIVMEKAEIHLEAIVVDDGSPDGTAEWVEYVSRTDSRIRLIRRAGKLGLSSAVLCGFESARGDVLAVMDADLSHPVEALPQLFELVKKGMADLAIGSRYVPGGAIEGWGWYRKILSRGAILLSRFFTPVRDTMSGYFVVRRSALEGGLRKGLYNPRGFKILLDILVKTPGLRVEEVPIVFINRTEGKSKNGVGEIFAYLRNLLSYL